MKRCPYCGADNDDAADACYNCGQDLTSAPAPGGAPEPTQPLHTRRGQAGGYAPNRYPPSPHDTQPLPPYPPPGGGQPGYPQPNNPPPQAYYPPAEGQPPAYPPAYYAPASYAPPPPPPAEAPRRSCAWPLAGAALGLACLCILALALMSFTGAGRAIASRLKGQLASTGSVFAGATPTPWPTATPEASQPQPDLTVTPDATQQAYIDKLLSPGCKSALDTLSQESNAATQDPLKLLDETWRAGFNDAVSAMKTNCGTLDSASPVPGQVAKLNQSITQASNALDQANQLWNDAVNNRSPSQAIQAAQHIGAAARYLGQALSEIRAIAP